MRPTNRSPRTGRPTGPTDLHSDLQVSVSDIVGVVWPALVGMPVSLALAAADRSGTALATAGFVVTWLLVSAFRLKRRSRLAPIAIYICLVLYSFLMSILLAIIALDGDNPLEGLFDLTG